MTSPSYSSKVMWLPYYCQGVTAMRGPEPPFALAPVVSLLRCVMTPLIWLAASSMLVDMSLPPLVDEACLLISHELVWFRVDTFVLYMPLS